MTINGRLPAGLDRLEEILRARICSVCVDRNLDGACHLELERECALFNSFPKIVQAVSSVRSEWIEDYVAAIREAVCAECSHQDADGFCRVRGEVRCVLDRYLMLIVETIEEAQGITLKPSGSWSPATSTLPGQTLRSEFRRSAAIGVNKQSEA